MKMKLNGIILLLLLAMPFVVASDIKAAVINQDGTQEENGGWSTDTTHKWIIKENTKTPTNEFGIQSRSKERTCNLDYENCRIHLRKKSREAFIINDQEFTIEYKGWSYPFWVRGEQAAVIKIKNKDTNLLMCWQAIPKKYYFDNMEIFFEIESITTGRVYLEMRKIEK